MLILKLILLILVPGTVFTLLDKLNILFMRAIAILSLIFLAAWTFTSCGSSKKVTSNQSKMQSLYKSLKAELPQAQVTMAGDTVKVIYPEIAMFDFGKDQLKAEARPSFVKFARVIKAYPELNFIINGHTDNVGTDDVNMDLSLRRAETGKNILVENGVQAARMSTNGKGAERPIMSNDTDQGRASNRRVEFLLYLTQ